MERFGISAAQAALDFRLYLSLSASAPVYDSVRKTYVALKKHAPLIHSSLPDALEVIRNPKDKSFSLTLPKPERCVPTETIGRLYQAMVSKRAIQVRYTSMTSGAHAGQWIAPVHCISDGDSVYVRAFSFKHGEYRDYLPIRIDPFSSFDERPLDELLPPDRDWATIATIYLKPKKGLSAQQAAVVMREYGFEGKYLAVEVCKALEFYFDRRWGLDQKNCRLERAKTAYRKAT